VSVARPRLAVPCVDHLRPRAVSRVNCHKSLSKPISEEPPNMNMLFSTRQAPCRWRGLELAPTELCRVHCSARTSNESTSLKPPSYVAPPKMTTSAGRRGRRRHLRHLSPATSAPPSPWRCPHHLRHLAEATSASRCRTCSRTPPRICRSSPAATALKWASSGSPSCRSTWSGGPRRRQRAARHAGSGSARERSPPSTPSALRILKGGQGKLGRARN